jgi:hypothetical protein
VYNLRYRHYIYSIGKRAGQQGQQFFKESKPSGVARKATHPPTFLKLFEIVALVALI